MKVTVILATSNRCNQLSGVLGSLAASVLPDSVAWGVLVVDNNSRDGTRKVVEHFRQLYPGRFRYIFEPQPGKSFALNSGIREADADVLAFTDDDVLVESSWLRNLTAPLQNGPWIGVGGRTLMTESFTPPLWLAVDGPFNMAGIVGAVFDVGDEPRQLGDAPFGVNMAFRTEAFAKYGGFRTDLGPSPDPRVPRPNEDTEFGRRLMRAGERLLYQPAAVVRHPLHRDRVSKDYFLNWWFDAGRASVRESIGLPAVYGIRRPYLAMLKSGLLLLWRGVRWTLAPGRQRRFYRKCWVWKTAGQIIETRRLLVGN